VTVALDDRSIACADLFILTVARANVDDRDAFAAARRCESVLVPRELRERSHHRRAQRASPSVHDNERRASGIAESRAQTGIVSPPRESSRLVRARGVCSQRRSSRKGCGARLLLRLRVHAQAYAFASGDTIRRADVVEPGGRDAVDYGAVDHRVVLRCRPKV
jgi:hypothetical protein